MSEPAHRFAYQLKGRRCSCWCTGQGFLLFIACPDCGQIALACDESDSVFTELKNPSGRSDSSRNESASDLPQNQCPLCHKRSYHAFRYASRADLVAANIDLSLTEESYMPLDE